VKEISAGDAHLLMQQDPETIYLDVRSIPEFEQGHPANAWNIPLLHFRPGMGMLPNDHFVQVVEVNLPKNAHVVVGCKTGARSARACEILSELGYTDVTNVRGGFVGVMDNFGRVVEPGWSLLDLPMCNVCSEECKYEHLAAKAKK
jgi:phage shock protein E